MLLYYLKNRYENDFFRLIDDDNTVIIGGAIVTINQNSVTVEQDLSTVTKTNEIIDAIIQFAIDRNRSFDCDFDEQTGIHTIRIC